MSLTTPRTVVTAGASMFADALVRQAVDVVPVDWQPPVVDPTRLAAVMADPRRPGANAKALAAMLGAQAHLVDVRPASEVLGLERGRLLHAGPPVDWERASGPMRGALIGALLFEGWADTAEQAERLLAAGDGVSWEPCHGRGAVGPMAGVVSPSMWVFCLRDESTGHESWCSLNEGLGKVLRYGAYEPSVVERLHWMTDAAHVLTEAASVQCPRGTWTSASAMAARTIMCDSWPSMGTDTTPSSVCSSRARWKSSRTGFRRAGAPSLPASNRGPGSRAPWRARSAGTTKSKAPTREETDSPGGRRPASGRASQTRSASPAASTRARRSRGRRARRAWRRRGRAGPPRRAVMAAAVHLTSFGVCHLLGSLEPYNTTPFFMCLR